MQPDPHEKGTIIEEIAIPEASRSAAAPDALPDDARTLLKILFGSTDECALLDALPAMVFFKARDHRYLFVNTAYADHYRLPRERILGKRDHEIFAPETARTFHESDESVMASGVPKLNTILLGERSDGTALWSMENDIPFRDASGRVAGMVGVVVDVTDRKLAEEALLRTEAELLVARAHLVETIAALSTPVLPIDDGILVLPLVGHIDSTRSAQIMEALLQGVNRFSAEYVIIDLTGVPSIDRAIATHLLRAAHAATLLGTQCILVGMSPAIAQSLVQTGVEFDRVIVLGNLQTGVRYARLALPARSY